MTNMGFALSTHGRIFMPSFIAIGLPFFNIKIPVGLAHQYLDKYNVPMDFSEVTIPDDRQLEKAARAARVSAAGPDGIPYSAWAKSPRAL